GGASDDPRSVAGAGLDDPRDVLGDVLPALRPGDLPFTLDALCDGGEVPVVCPGGWSREPHPDDEREHRTQGHAVAVVLQPGAHHSFTSVMISPGADRSPVTSQP